MHTPADRRFTRGPLLWRHKGKLAGCLLVGLAAALAYTALVPWTFTSEAMLFLRLGRETANLDPTASSQAAAGEDSRENAMNSLGEILKSRAVREQLVDALGPEAILESDPSSSPGPVGRMLRQLRLLGPYDLREKAIQRAGEQLVLTNIKKSSLLMLRYRAEDPQTARDVLAKLIELGRQRQVQVLQTAGSKELFASQVETLRKGLSELESQRRGLRDRFGLASFDRQRDAHLNRMASVEAELAQTQVSLGAVDAEMAAQQKALEALPETIVLGESQGHPNSATEGMRQQLFTLQIRLQELLAKYQPDTFFVKDVREQLEGVKQALAKESSQPQVTRGRNTAYQELQLALLRARSQRDGLAARQTGLTAQLASAGVLLRQFNERESQLAELDLRIELERENYRKYAQSLEQIRIDQAIAEQSLSNINLLEEPTLSPVPTSPVLTVNVGLGLFLGLSLGLIAMALSERRRRPYRSAADLEEDLDLPVMASLPRVVERAASSRSTSW